MARPRKPQIDPGTLTIEKNVGIIPTNRGRRSSPWIPLLRKMKIGDSVLIPNSTAARMGYIRVVAQKLGLSIVLRNAPDGAVRMWLTESKPMARRSTRRAAPTAR
jgi:hypothetical protein